MASCSQGSLPKMGAEQAVPCFLPQGSCQVSGIKKKKKKNQEIWPQGTIWEALMLPQGANKQGLVFIMCHIYFKKSKQQQQHLENCLLVAMV